MRRALAATGGLFCALVMAATGCQEEDFAGRLASRQPSIDDLVSRTADEDLTLETLATSDPQLGERATFRAEAKGPYRGVALELPDGQFVYLAQDRNAVLGPEAPERWVFRFEDEGPFEDILARYPDGSYSFLLELSGRPVLIVTIQGSAPLPEAPIIMEPLAEQAVSTGPLVLWSGHAQTFQVVAVEQSSGQSLLLADGLQATSFQIPAGTLEPRGRYRIEVRAFSGPVTFRRGSAASVEVVVVDTPSNADFQMQAIGGR